MKRLRLGLNACILVTAMVPACGGDSTELTPVPVTSDFLASLATAFCYSIQSCCGQYNLTYSSTCAATMESNLRKSWWNGDTENVDFHQEYAQACLDAIRSVGIACTPDKATWDSYLVACRRVLTGHRNPGETCSTTAECLASDNGAVCETPSKKCQSYKVQPLGQPCNLTCSSSGCQGVPPTSEPAGVCLTSQNLRCDQGVCSNPKNLGEVCGAIGACGSSAYCSDPTQGGTCVAALSQGEQCTSQEQCGNGVCKASNVCEAKQPLGGICSASSLLGASQCESTRCVSSRCVPSNLIVGNNTCLGLITAPPGFGTDIFGL